MKSSRIYRRRRVKLRRDEKRFIIEQILGHEAHLICVRCGGKAFWLVRLIGRKSAVAVYSASENKIYAILPPDLPINKYLEMKV
jgi:hypothetical protein